MTTILPKEEVERMVVEVAVAVDMGKLCIVTTVDRDKQFVVAEAMIVVA